MNGTMGRKTGLRIVAGALLGALFALPALATDSERYRMEGVDRTRGPFMGLVQLTAEGDSLRVVREVRFRNGDSERLSGVGNRSGGLLQAELARAVGAAGRLSGGQSSAIQLSLRLLERGFVESECREGGKAISRGHGERDVSTPRVGARQLDPADLGPKTAGRLQSDYAVARFRGVPFVKGAKDTVQIDPNDPEQGALGDCYLVAAMIAVAKTDPGVIRRMITSRGGGNYTVRLKGLGGWGSTANVKINDRFPATGKGKAKLPAYVSSSDRQQKGSTKLFELWPSLIEKAYATNQGGFAKIVGGHSDGPFAFMSGKSSPSYQTWWRSTKEIQSLIDTARMKGHPVCVGMKNDTGKLGRRLSVVGCHVYVLWGKTGGRYQLYNPWQSSHPSRPVTATELGKLASHIYVGEF
jgi:hypothetical protein